ncbi:MAG TPA: bL21 family ribosomal protein, partial [Thermoanaerobaculia bacterium]
EKPSRSPAKGEELRLSEVVFAGGAEAERDREAKGWTVKATVINEVRGPKVIVFKKKRTKQYRRTKGHRQTMLEIRIDAIEAI